MQSLGGGGVLIFQNFNGRNAVLQSTDGQQCNSQQCNSPHLRCIERSHIRRSVVFCCVTVKCWIWKQTWPRLDLIKKKSDFLTKFFVLFRSGLGQGEGKLTIFKLYGLSCCHWIPLFHAHVKITCNQPKCIVLHSFSSLKLALWTLNIYVHIKYMPVFALSKNYWGLILQCLD